MRSEWLTERKLGKPKGAIDLYFVISYSALKFSKNIQFYVAVFPEILIPILFSILWWTTKILYRNPKWKLSLRSIIFLRGVSQCSHHFIERWKIELEWNIFGNYIWNYELELDVRLPLTYVEESAKADKEMSSKKIWTTNIKAEYLFRPVSCFKCRKEKQLDQGYRATMQHCNKEPSSPQTKHPREALVLVFSHANPVLAYNVKYMLITCLFNLL